MRVGQTAESLIEFREAVRLAPQWPLGLGALAWILSTSPDERIRNPNEATKLAERAAEMTGNRDPLILDFLAAAYAAAGRFEEAVTTAQAAIGLAAAAGDERLADKVRQRLLGYQQGRPYREPLRKRAPAAP